MNNNEPANMPEHLDNGYLANVGKRRILAYNLRQKKLTFKAIGEKMGISAGRARELYFGAVWRITRPFFTDSLPGRAANILNKLNITSREEAFEAFTTGRLKPGCVSYGYGFGTHKDIAKWLGLPAPKKSRKRFFRKKCPYCDASLVFNPELQTPVDQIKNREQAICLVRHYKKLAAGLRAKARQIKRYSDDLQNKLWNRQIVD